MSLELLVNSWIAATGGPDEVRQTLASLRIIVGDYVATRVVDEFSKSYRDEVYLSAYPLALWLASSWWRLRWEPGTFKNAPPNVSWRMAHEMAAAGCGFLWPRLRFESDGERVDVFCHRPNPTRIEPVQYIEEFRTSITASEFENAVDEFVEVVLARLDVVGLCNTQLRTIWNEVRSERADSVATQYRRLEAMLGYEPDEAPEEIISRFENLSQEAGQSAAAEIVLICSRDNPVMTLNNVIARAHSQGIEGQVQQASELSAAFNAKASVLDVPWERGRQLAHLARSHWNLTADTISDNTLSKLMNIDEGAFKPEATGHTGEPLGLAVRTEAPDCLKILFRRQNHPGRRFESARILADYLSASSADRWLPITDSKTARQKIQRAFAAEFLCPIDALKKFLDGDYSDEAIDEASDHFQVSFKAVHSHLANNHLLEWTQEFTF